MQFISVERTIGFRRLPVPQSGAKARFALADHKQRWSAPRKSRKVLPLYVTQSTSVRSLLNRFRRRARHLG
jgi:hypothetical protein